MCCYVRLTFFRILSFYLTISSNLGVKYIVAINGSFYPVDGTSASCPVVAGMISLVNSARIRRGKPTLGWINPTLYTKANHLLRDVTVGENKCLRATDTCCAEGFSSTPGWDPVTGWGTIDFEKFKTFFVDLNIAPQKKRSKAYNGWNIHYKDGYFILYLSFMGVLCFIILYCLTAYIIRFFYPNYYSEVPHTVDYGSIEQNISPNLLERENII